MFPTKVSKMVCYYGYYSNVARGKRKKNDQDELVPSIPEPDGASWKYKRNRARLRRKIYEVEHFETASHK